MSDALAFVLALIIAVGAFLSVQGAFVLINYFTFQRDFLEELTRKGIAKPGLREALINTSLMRGLLFFGGCSAVCLVLAILSRPRGFIAYILVAVFSLVFFRPAKAMYTRSGYNIAEFLKKYGAFLNTAKYKNEYAEKLADSKLDYTR